MTAAVPRSPRADNRRSSSAADNGNGNGNGNGTENRKRQGSRLPALSITLGALSAATFWVVGLCFLLGVAAVVCGAVATTRSAVADDEAASLRALLGIVAGAAGITVSAIALFPMLAQL